MEWIIKWLVSVFPKPNIKMICKVIDTPDKEDSFLKRYIRFFISLLGHIAGKYLVKHQIVPYHIYKSGETKEDPGVTEMRALLRGEDCFDYNLDQSQLRTSLPGDINPYEEYYLASFHYRALRVIMRLLDSLKKHDEPFAQSFNGIFSWFDKTVVSYLGSEVVINKRD